MFDGDVAVTKVALEAVGLIQAGVEVLAEVHILGCAAQAGLRGGVGLHLLQQGAHIHPCLLEDPTRQALLGQQAREQVVGVHVLLALLLRQLLGRHDGAPGLLGEQLSGGMHGVLTRCRNRMGDGPWPWRGAPNRLIRSSPPRLGSPKRLGVQTVRLCRLHASVAT